MSTNMSTNLFNYTYYDFTVDPENLFTRSNCIMELKLFVDNNDNAFLQKYKDHISAHNSKLFFDKFPDSGFDLLMPNDQLCSNVSNGINGSNGSNNNVNKINFNVKCSAQLIYDTNLSYQCGYYMYPRSSLSKTLLRLANSIGIIDSGYRGNLIGMFDVIGTTYSVNKFDRLLQICAPNLVPIYFGFV